MKIRNLKISKTILFILPISVFIAVIGCTKVDESINSALDFEGVFASTNGNEVRLEVGQANLGIGTFTKVGNSPGISVGDKFCTDMRRVNDNTWEGIVRETMGGTFNFLSGGKISISINDNRLYVEPYGKPGYSYTRINSDGTTGGGTSGGIYNGSKPTGNLWSRNDGAGMAYLSLSGSIAKACASGKETVGTFNSAKPSMTFTIGTDVIEFPLLFTNGLLIVGVPNQAVTTNNPTQYVSATSYNCGAGGTAGAVRPKGQFKIIINRPTGNCSSSNTASHRLAWTAGTVVSSSFNSQGIQSGSIRIINQGSGPQFNSTENSWTYFSLSGQSKLNWEFFPDASQWPSSCSQIGESFIDFEGQVKTITIW